MDSIAVSRLDEIIIKDAVSRLVSIVDPLKIILFGSYAYGKPHEGSDLDILVVVNNKTKSRYETTVKCYGALRDLSVSKDVVVATPSMIHEWSGVPESFISTIVNKGRVVYEKTD
jgi:predicted nucleotidyltransferase